MLTGIKAVFKKTLTNVIAADVLMMSLGLGVITTMMSCGDSNVKDSKEVAEEHNETKFNKAEEKDAQFVVDAASMHLDAKRMSDSVGAMSSSNAIKELSVSMSDFHEKNYQEIKSFAASKLISIPNTATENVTNELKDISKKDAEDRDKEYVSKMLSMHEDAIKKFEKTSTSAEDADLRAWSEIQLKDLRMLTDKLISIRDKEEKSNK